MANFCPSCSNLMVTLSTSDTFLFKCVKCEKIKQPTDENTLILEEKNKVDIIVFKSVLQNAGSDPVNPKVEKKCEKCNYMTKNKTTLIQHDLNEHATIKERKEKFRYYCKD